MKRKLLFVGSLLLLLSGYSIAQTNFPLYSDTTEGLVAHKILMNNDGSFVVLATKNEYTPFYLLSGQGFSVSKYDNNGVQIWNNTIHTTALGQYIYATDIVKSVDSNGYVIVADSALSSGMTIDPNYILTLKLDENGNRTWTTFFDDSSSSWGFGHYHMIKSVPSTREYYVSNYFKAYKLNSVGNRIFTNTNPGMLYNFIVDTNQSVITVNAAGTPNIIFADSNYNVVNTKPLTANVSYFDIANTTDGHFLTIGSYSLSNSDYVIILNKLNPDGTQQWEKSFTVNDIPLGTTIFQKDSNYFITASLKTCLNADTPANCHGVSDAIIIKADTAGNEISRISFNGTYNSTGKVKSFFGLQSVYYADTIFTLGTATRLNESGFASESATSSSYVVWKTAIASFISLSTINKTVSTAGIIMYPVPADKFLTIDCTAYQGNEVTVSIYNMVGQQLKTYKFFGINNLNIHTSDIVSGNYLLKITSGESTIIKHFVVAH